MLGIIKFVRIKFHGLFKLMQVITSLWTPPPTSNSQTRKHLGTAEIRSVASHKYGRGVKT